MTQYASKTIVSSSKTRQEIEDILTRYKATKFGYGLEDASATIVFEIAGRRVRFLLPLPDRTSDEFVMTKHAYPKVRSIESQRAEYEQAIRQRWRALALCIKAKLEAVECGISTFEDEFMANVVMPDGRTIGDHIRPQIAIAYETGKMQKLLAASWGA